MKASTFYHNMLRQHDNSIYRGQEEWGIGGARGLGVGRGWGGRAEGEYSGEFGFEDNKSKNNIHVYFASYSTGPKFKYFMLFCREIFFDGHRLCRSSTQVLVNISSSAFIKSIVGDGVLKSIRCQAFWKKKIPSL